MAKKTRPVEPDLTEKLYYTIGEVAKLVDVKAHVLRYWENEFPSLSPRKGRGGSRRYRKRDIEEVLTIKRLLYDEGFRIAGAKKHLEEERRAKPKAEAKTKQLDIGFNAMKQPEQIAHIRDELQAIRALLQEAREAEG